MTDVAVFQVSDRARRFGYIIWPSSRDAALRAILGDAETVQVTFLGEDLGRRRIDWKHRRISVGPRRAKAIPARTEVQFRVLNDSPDRIRVDCS